MTAASGSILAMNINTHKSIAFAMMATCTLLNGCFTRDDPFYEESQIVRVPGFEGAYHNLIQSTSGRSDGASWLVSRSLDDPERYELAIREGDVTVVLLGTFFKVTTNLFLDLYPLTDKPVPPGGLPKAAPHTRQKRNKG